MELEELKINRTVEDIIYEEQNKPIEDRQKFYGIAGMIVLATIALLIY